MFKHQYLKMACLKLKYFEVVGCGSETQVHVGGNLNKWDTITLEIVL